MTGEKGILRIGLGLFGLIMLLGVDPALANKFETIGGGVSGSVGIKREWLEKIFFVAAGISLLGAIAAVLFPHRNPLFLNYSNWKSSAIIMSILGIAFLAAGLAI